MIEALKRRPAQSLRATLIALSLFVLSACGTAMKAEDFANSQPRLEIETFFAGKVKAWGMFEDRFGKVRRQFTVDIDGTWDGRQLVLDERFLYSDGERERRVWTIVKTGEHTYTGTAGDVIGTAQGKSYGNALNWAYDMNLKVDDGTWKVSFDDWMFLQPDGVLLNRAVVRRWGIVIGSVTLAFARADKLDGSGPTGTESAAPTKPE
jgi:hypothetical protein